MRILFSPVGGNDPMSENNYHDGAMLHIARHYKPDKIYLFISKEMLEVQKKDDRFHRGIKLLGDYIGHTFVWEDICREEMVNVHLFDEAYGFFMPILKEITEKLEKNDELLINITSGTPAMKNALLVIATMVDIPCTCIQVDTPEHRQNDQIHMDDYDVEGIWEINPDNQYEEGDKNYNRNHAVKLHSLQRLKYEETIRKYVRTYNYHAAYMLAREMRADDTRKYLNRLAAASARQALDADGVDKLVRNLPSKSKEYYKPHCGTERVIYEYMLAEQSRVRRGQYADFIRGLSPLLADLFKNVIVEQTGIPIQDFITVRNGKEKWNQEAIDSDVRMSVLRDILCDKPFVATKELLVVLNRYCTQKEVRDCFSKLRKVEEDSRNMAAHTMVSVSDTWVKEKTGLNCEEIVNKIQEGFTYSSYGIKTIDWESYDAMNQDIIDSM